MANYLDPYASELQGIQRQQEIAKMLLQQGQQQPQEQMVSGRVAPINPLQAFLPALNTYQGMNLQKNAEADTKKLADLVRGERQAEITNIASQMYGSPDYKPATTSNEIDINGDVVPTNQAQVGIAPNYQQALANILKSDNPMAHQFLAPVMAKLSNDPVYKELSQGASLIGIDKSGKVSQIAKNEKPEEIPNEVRGAALRLGLPNDSKSWTPTQLNAITELIREDKKSGRSISSNTTNVSTGKAYGSEFGNLIAKNDVDSYTIAQSAPKILEQSNQIKSLINKGALTGTGSDFVLSAAKAFNVVGANNAETIKNTELLVSSLGQNVLNNIKTSGLGAGQGFTDKDRIFLERVVGGQIALDKKTLLDLADLQEKAAKASVTKWNDRVKTIPPEVLQATGIGAITLPTGVKYLGPVGGK